ncbi:MAG TPA: hypothetical protein VK179_20775 [Bacteroidales bacterium]|nr:hypothetical protein [Bacteroidales bacterium]
MRKVWFLFVILVLFRTGLYAGNPPDPNWPKNSISFNLVTPFDLNFPRFRLGYTNFFSDHWSHSIQVGFGSHMIFPDSTFYYNHPLEDNYKLWEIRSEGRYYVSGMREHVMPYVGLDIFYIHHTQTMHNSSFIATNGTEWTYGTADYLRRKAGFNIIGGAVFRMNRILAIETYGGVGVRMRNNSYYNVESLTPGEKWFESLNYYYKEGVHWTYNLTCGVRISFMF